MPVHPVKGQPGCYQWGDSGKVYCGKDAKEKAEAQGRAIYASGYKGKAEMEMVSSDYQEGDGRWWLFHTWETKKDDLDTIYTYDTQNDYQMWVLINPYKMGGIMTFICTTNNGDARQKCLNWIRSNTPKIKGKYQYEQRNKIENSANNGNYFSIELKELSYQENKFARSRIESFSRMRAEDNQKKHQTIDDANIGDVFRFGDGWELFVLKSKEIDGYDYPPAVIYKIVFDPYISSPVSDIEGLIRDDEKIRLWNNPRLEIFKKRRSLKKEAESSSKPHSVTISRSSNPEKKLMAVFEDSEGKKMKTTHFGQRGASDYTKHGDKERMQRYLERHGGGNTTSTKEDWKDPTTAGALSRWILWNKPSLSGSFADYKRRFGLKGSLNVSKSSEGLETKNAESYSPGNYDFKPNFGEKNERFDEILESAQKLSKPKLKRVLGLEKENPLTRKPMIKAASISYFMKEAKDQFPKEMYIEYYMKNFNKRELCYLNLVRFWRFNGWNLTELRKLTKRRLSDMLIIEEMGIAFNSETKVKSKYKAEFEAKSPAQKSLNKWTKEDWGTKSGKPSTQGEEATGERYLPRKARESLTDKEYARTSDKKREDSKKGKQFSDQPKSIADKVAKYRSETFEANDMIKERYFEKQLKKYKDKLNWYYLSRNPSLTPALIEKYENKLGWFELSFNPSLTPALIEKYKDKLNWEELSKNPALTPALIEKYEDKLDWEELSRNPSLTPALIEKYKDKLKWQNLSYNPALTPAFIEKYEDKLDWNVFSYNPSLTPAIIEKYKDKLNWNYLSQNPSLTPALIEKYENKLNWDYLSRNPSLTPALIEKYENK